MRRALALGIVLALAGCGGTTRNTRSRPPPHLPRALAHAWAARAEAVAQALAGDDGCTARSLAEQLQGEVASAVSADQVPLRYRGALTAAVDALPGRITCNPSPPPQPAPTPPGDHGNGKDHGKHRGQGGDEKG